MDTLSIQAAPSKRQHIQSTLVISNFTGPDKYVRVISSSRQPNCDVIGMRTVRLCSPKRAWKAHVYDNLNNLRVLQFALLLFVLGDAMVLLKIISSIIINFKRLLLSFNTPANLDFHMSYK